MSDRPTPETDTETMRDEYDHVDTDFGPFAPSDTVPAEFARQLERERDEANDKMVSAECDVREIASAMEKVKQERDYVREAFVIAVDEMVRAQCRTREAIRERDELRKKCASWICEFRKLRDLCRQLDEDANDRLRERDEARAFIEELVDLVAYGLGQHASIWSQAAMTKAREAIAKSKSLEGAK